MRNLIVFTLVCSLCALAALPATASSFRRAGLDRLVADNERVVVGTVVDAVSYWNLEGSMILTDFRISPSTTLKGVDDGGFLTVTQMGGTVDDTSVLIVGGAELVAGREYVLFIDRDSLPGVGRVQTVREHAQGAFEVVESARGERAVSTAVGHPLLPDADGVSEPPGGTEGLPLDELETAIEGFVRGAQGSGAVKREVVKSGVVK